MYERSERENREKENGIFEEECENNGVIGTY